MVLPIMAKDASGNADQNTNATVTTKEAEASSSKEKPAGTVSGNSLVESAKEAAPKVWDATKSTAAKAGQIAKEKAPIVVDKAKDVGSKVAEKAKGAAPIIKEKIDEVVEDAGLEGPNRYESSQEKFMQWFSNMTGTN